MSLFKGETYSSKWLVVCIEQYNYFHPKHNILMSLSSILYLSISRFSGGECICDIASNDNEFVTLQVKTNRDNKLVKHIEP